MYGLERSSDNSMMVVCQDEVMVVTTCNDVVVDGVVDAVDFAAIDGFVVVVGAAAATVV